MIRKVTGNSMTSIRKRHGDALVWITAFLSAVVCSQSIAQGVVNPLMADQYTTASEIDGDSLSQIHGVLGVNQAAGDSNAQSNSRAIAVSQDGGVAIAYTFDKQSVDLNESAIPEVALSRIGENAFNGTSGLISVNQASGVQNMQLNAFAMAMNINGELSDTDLAGTLSDTPVDWPESAVPSNTQRAAIIDSTAFVGATGVVQLNQTAGSGNIASNRFEMSVGENR